MLYTVDEEKTALIAVSVILVVYLLAIGIGIANYIMRSLALYRIADRRQIPNPWMAWIPVAGTWLIGNIADDYDERNGMKRKWRAVLLTLSVIVIVGLLIGYIGLIAWMVKVTVDSRLSYVGDPTGMILAVIVIYAFIIFVAVVAMAKSFCEAICIYKIFESTVPEKSVKYLLLYLLVPLAGSICLLKCKEKGYSKEAILPAGYPYYTGPVQEEIPEKTDSEE